MEHSELVAEMSQVEHLSTQDRLHLARMRRAHQLKMAKQNEKEWLKSQSRRDRNTNNYMNKQKKVRNITFQNSVVLLEAAARNDINEVEKLLECGVSPDATNEDGLTPLHQCCIDNNAEMLVLLLNYGANVNAKDSEKWTPLHAAATCGHLDLVRILISRGANLLAVNVDGNMPYDLCDDEESLDCIEAEMSRHGVTQELIDETRAATETQMLIDLNEIALIGGDLEWRDKQFATPLHISAANGYVKVVEFLLENHVNVDCVDKDLWTPVHAAACWGHMEVLEMLASCGADLNAKNKNNETPSDICEDIEIRERIEQLKTEQESKRLAEAQRRRVRRSQSNNTRAQSVRRTSLRDKTLTTKKDAVEEARLRLKAQEVGYISPESTTEPNSLITSDNQTGLTLQSSFTPTNRKNLTNKSSAVSISSDGNGNGNKIITNHSNNRLNHRLSDANHLSIYDGKSSVASLSPGVDSSSSSLPFDKTINRRSPDGRDNEDTSTLIKDRNPGVVLSKIGPTSNNNAVNDISTEIFSASNENGKINVQVTVLVDTHSLPDHTLSGTTLSHLKKQRAHSRCIGTPIVDQISPLPGSGSSKHTSPSSDSLLLSEGQQNGTLIVNSPSTLNKFSGVTSDIVSDSTNSSKNCCVIM